MAPVTERRQRWEVVGLLGALALLVGLTYADYGITWDETVELFRRHKGPRTLAFWLDGFDPDNAPFDTGHNPFVWFVYYSLFRMMETLGVAPAQIEAYHLFTGLIGVLGIGFAYRVARQLMPHRWALAAALLVALTPRLCGHAFGNFKDIPFAVAWLASLDTLLRAVAAPTRRNVLWHGVAIGALIVQRIGGLMFAPLSLLGLVLALRSPASPGVSALARHALIAVCIALGLHYVSYPYLLLRPIDGLVRLISIQSAFAWDGVTLTLGIPMAAEGLPVWYGAIWLLVTLPEVVLGGLVAGTAAALLRRRPHFRRRPPSAALGLTIASALLPFAWISLSRAPIYDGARHLLFVIPPLVLLAMVGWRTLQSHLRGPAIPVILAASGLVLAVQIVRLHPYQTVWFNSLVGGLDGADERWTLDYWATTAKASADWLGEHGQAPRTLCVVGALEDTWRVYLPDDWSIEDENDAGGCSRTAHYLWSYSRNDELRQSAAFAAGETRWSEVFRVERSATPLGILWRNDRPVTGLER
ncbi:MAG: hypothetical protein ACI9WU_004684 [Myxococcota bacterium]|jgi:hypothetical protein